MKSAYSACKKRYIERMRQAFRQYGRSPKALTWSGVGRQNLRFFMLTQIGDIKNKSILDVGCGFADLYGFLLEQGWRGKYTGIDIVEEYLEVAREKYRGIDVKLLDLYEVDFKKKFSYVFGCGIFNERIFNSIDDQNKYAQCMISKMFSISEVGVAVDFMSSYVDYKNERAYHPSPEYIFGLCKGLSKRVALRHDYMPYEFLVYIYKDDSIYKQKNIFTPYKELLREPAGGEWK